MPPWSGRRMTSFLSQSKPRNTHLGVAISAVTAKDAQGFFEHSGYHLPVHL